MWPGPVALQGHHPAGCLGQEDGEGPQAGADLHHGLVAAQFQGVHDAPGLVRVHQEVLAQAFLRPQAQTLQEDFGEVKDTAAFVALRRR